MKIEERRVGSVVVVEISGSLTLGRGATRVKDKINSLLCEGRRYIVLNLANLSYVDSGGLGQLVSSFTGVQREGGTLALANVGGRLSNVLAITKLLTVFDTYASEEEAVARLQARRPHLESSARLAS